MQDSLATQDLHDQWKGLYSSTVINEIGREFGTFIVEAPASAGKGPRTGRYWKVRCKACNAVTEMRGSDIRRHASGKRTPRPCLTCSTIPA